MKYAYRIMMTEMCEIPVVLNVRPGCSMGFSEKPEIMEEILYDTAEEAFKSFNRFRSVATGIVMDKNLRKTRGVREFYIEKIKVGADKRNPLSYGAVKYAPFEEFEDYVPSICSEAPEPVRRTVNKQLTAAV